MAKKEVDPRITDAVRNLTERFVVSQTMTADKLYDLSDDIANASRLDFSDEATLEIFTGGFGRLVQEMSSSSDFFKLQRQILAPALLQIEEAAMFIIAVSNATNRVGSNLVTKCEDIARKQDEKEEEANRKAAKRNGKKVCTCSPCPVHP